jgi:tRNA acetyltransferase TAN1
MSLNVSQLADNLWPEETPGDGEQEVVSIADELSLEAQIADEMSALQKPRKAKRFGNIL